MSESFSERTSVGWLSRIGQSIKGIFVGLALVLVAVVALFWNEGRSIHRARALSDGRGAVVEASPDRVDPAQEAKLIHLTGDGQAAGTLRDTEFGVAAPRALRLQRSVEMYQWDEDKKTETTKKLGGGEERVTTYTYKQDWSERLLDSSAYHTAGHDNPKRKPFASEIWNAPDATLGQFEVNEVILEDLSPTTVIVPPADVVAAMNPVAAAATQMMPATRSLAATVPTTSPVAPAMPRVADGMLYLADPARPKNGDVRIAFKSVPAGPISVIARQTGATFAPYVASTGEVLLVEPGTVSAEGMFKHAEDANRMLTWIIRGVGFVVLAIGFGMVFAPLAVVADVVPFIGSIVGAGTFIAALLFAIPVWFLTVGIAWLFYRPLLGIALLAIAVAGPIVILKLRKPKTPTPTRAAAIA